MKILFFSLAAFAALAVAASAQAPVGPGSVVLGKIQPSVIKTPDYTITGGPQKRTIPQNWLEVEVPFETFPEEIDELTFKYTILLEKTLLDGTVTHVVIPKGKDHYSVMYVAPRSLLKITGGRPLTSASIGNVWITVEKQGQTLAQASFKPSAMPNLPHLGGLVLDKTQTPFAPLFFDRYEAIKAK
jgi:hypothetical protein